MYASKLNHYGFDDKHIFYASIYALVCKSSLFPVIHPEPENSKSEIHLGVSEIENYLEGSEDVRNYIALTKGDVWTTTVSTIAKALCAAATIICPSVT